jgi:hypothetical protein
LTPRTASETPRVALVLPSGADLWRVANLTLGFTRLAAQLAGNGFAVDLILPADVDQRIGPELPAGVSRTNLRFTGPPIIAGPGSASMTASLKAGHQLWRHLSANPPDIVFGPLAGGALQPSLMSRAVGESLGGTMMVALAEATTTERLRLGDIEQATVSALVDEALETATLRLVDAVAGFRDLEPACGKNPRILRFCLPAGDQRHSDRPPGPKSFEERAPFEEIVFVGPASARHGAPAFLAEIERLGHAGVMAGRRVTFLGPWREGPLGIGKAMLGRRARDWSFTFTQRDETRLDRILDYLKRPGVLAVFPGAAGDDEVMLVDAVNAGVDLMICAHHPLAHWLGGAVHVSEPGLADLGQVLIRGPRAMAEPPAAFHWPAEFRRLLAERDRRETGSPQPRPSASLCITHRDRAASLGEAIESAGIESGKTADLVIVDTGSRSQDALARIAALEATAGARILRMPPGAQQGAARNLAATHATGDILVFLDDDNVFLDGGFGRLVGAFANSDFDIVVSNLRLHDDPFREGKPAADLVFLGDAGSAGLIFNGFGDANFAIRAEAFRRVGGFADTDGAAFDWLFLARARAAGLGIGVLQGPAVGYARNLAGRETKWRTRDLEGPRRELIGIYDLPGRATAIVANLQSLTLAMMD